MGLPSSQTLTVFVNADSSYTGTGSHKYESYIGKNTSAPYQDDAYWKYIIGHEIGQAVHHATFGLLDVNYSAGDSLVPLCTCTNQIPVNDWDGPAHCLESQETTTSAEEEGMAHFFANRIFNAWNNSAPKFAYYKKTCNPSAGTACTSVSFPAIAPPRVYNVLANTKWLETNCGSSSTIAGKGNEEDWNTFYWRWNNQSPNYSYMSEIFDVYRTACGGSTCSSATVSWAQLDAAAQSYLGFGTPKYSRFSASSSSAGVQH